jgi:tetraacyldisaccharide 4'-kinase
MARGQIKRIERLEDYLVRIIQQPGADRGHPWPIRVLLVVLHGISLIFKTIVLLRLWFYRTGIFHRYPLGCQIISVGNITAGGTGKTPVVEIFARELLKSWRRTAVFGEVVLMGRIPWLFTTDKGCKAVRL